MLSLEGVQVPVLITERDIMGGKALLTKRQSYCLVVLGMFEKSSDGGAPKVSLQHTNTGGNEKLTEVDFGLLATSQIKPANYAIILNTAFWLPLEPGRRGRRNRRMIHDRVLKMTDGIMSVIHSDRDVVPSVDVVEVWNLQDPLIEIDDHDLSYLVARGDRGDVWISAQDEKTLEIVWAGEIMDDGELRY